MSAVLRRAPQVEDDEPRTARRTARGSAGRERSRTWIALQPLVVLALLLLLLLAGVWVVFASPLLRVEAVEVTGTRVLTPDRVRAAAAVPMDRPLARTHLERIEQAVERLAWVADAEVTRDWPHTVFVAVQERVPVASVVRGDERVELVDASGAVLATTEEAQPGLPVVLAAEAAGDEQAAAAAVQAALDVVSTMPGDLLLQVASVSPVGREDVRLTLADGRSVLWGGPDAGDRKALVLGALLGQEADVIDVSAPDAPTTR